MQFLLKLLADWRIILVGSAVAGGLALYAYARIEHGRAERAQAAAQIATRQAQLDQATTKAVDHYTQTVTVIREKADAGVQSVQKAPGAEQAIPEDVLAAWRAGLDGLRDETGSAPGDDPR